MNDLGNIDGASTSATVSAPPEPQGQAALLLVESLIHGLIAKATLSIAEAVEIVDIAADTREQIATDREEDPEIMTQSLQMLNAIADSLRRDIP